MMITWLVILTLVQFIMLIGFVGLLLRQNSLELRMDRLEYIINREDGIAP